MLLCGIVRLLDYRTVLGFSFAGFFQVPGLSSWAESTSEVAVNMCMDSTSEQRDKRRRMDIEVVDHNDFPVIPIANFCPIFSLQQSCLNGRKFYIWYLVKCSFDSFQFVQLLSSTRHQCVQCRLLLSCRILVKMFNSAIDSGLDF